MFKVDDTVVFLYLFNLANPSGRGATSQITALDFPRVFQLAVSVFDEERRSLLECWMVQQVKYEGLVMFCCMLGLRSIHELKITMKQEITRTCSLPDVLLLTALLFASLRFRFGIMEGPHSLNLVLPRCVIFFLDWKRY